MQRRLTAILSADVTDYSGLMEVDEAGTLERLKANRRRIFDPCVATKGGRVVKLMGDGALDLLDPMLKRVRMDSVHWTDLDAIRDHPRFKALLAAAESRLAKT